MSAAVPAVERRSPDEPFFSICIPQYNRTRHLIDALRALERQTFRSFEICISDDHSTDGLHEDLIHGLQASGMPFAFAHTPRNLRYDGNLRAALSLARGRYALLMGNDDCLAAPDTLQYLHDELTRDPDIGVVIGNFEDWTSGAVTHRVPRRAVYEGTADTAVSHFRNMAFVSGLVVNRAAADAFATDEADGSEMYQMFVLSRTIASGLKLLEVERSLVRKDLHVPGEFVDSYAKRPRLDPCPIIERPLPMGRIGQVVASAVAPYLSPTDAPRERERIFRQLYRFTYVFWLFEYRRVQSWNYAAGVSLGLRPRNVVGSVNVGWLGRWRLRALWLAISAAGLLIPVGLFDRLRERLYRVAKR